MAEAFDEHGEEARAKAKPPAFGVPVIPLLWVLVPQIAAFAFFGNVPWADEISVGRRLIAGVIFLAISAIASAIELLFSGTETRFRSAVYFWKMSFPVAAFFLFGAWWSLRAPPVVELAGTPAREAEIVLCVEKPFAASEKYFGGIARAETVSGFGGEALAGTRVRYSFARKNFPPDADAPGEGSRLCAVGVLGGIDAANFPSEGFREYLLRERVSASFSRAERVEILDSGQGAFPRFFSSVRGFLRERFEEISSDFGEFFSRAGNVAGAMIFGDLSLLSPEQKQNFLLTGTMHVFAVSGLHISILTAGALGALRLVRCPRIFAWILTLVGAWFYVQVIGAPPSAMRAWQMCLFIFAGTLLGRGRMAFHGLVFSAVVALTLEPSVIGNAGFRLSYFAVAGILLYGVPAALALESVVRERALLPALSQSAFAWKMRRFAGKFSRACVGAFCVTFSAFMSGASCIIELFGVCSLISLAANLVFVPFVSFAVWLTALATAIACVPLAGTFAGKWIFAVAAVPTLVLDALAEYIAKMPGVLELAFPFAGFGAFGSLLMFTLFFLGAYFPPLRERPALRFALPPLALCVFLLCCAF